MPPYADNTIHPAPVHNRVKLEPSDEPPRDEPMMTSVLDDGMGVVIAKIIIPMLSRPEEPSRQSVMRQTVNIWPATLPSGMEQMC